MKTSPGPAEGDPYDLQRFVVAQARTYARARDELQAGRKQSHWMWFIFPQVEGLGHSAMARKYAIADLDEARAYLAHPVLGARLRECAGILLGVEGRSATQIFGSPDDMKLCSSMTLFAAVDEASDSPFPQVLDKYYGGRVDERTLAILDGA